MNNTIISTNHPLIPNNSEYLRYRKIVSIHSEDRNIEKFPNASFFEIELPEDMINVEMVKLVSWCFPSNYDVFSIANKNLEFTFKFDSLSPPKAVPLPSDPEYAFLYALNQVYSLLTTPPNSEHEYVVTIQSGSYSPTQFAIELENRMNEIVTVYSVKLLTEAGLSALIPDYLGGLSNYLGGYNGFRVAFNIVSSRVWFGNNNASFTITNNSQYINKLLGNESCLYKTLPDFSNWGLPSNIGFTRRNESSKVATSPKDYRFYYTNFKTVPAFGGDGDWIYPDPYYNDVPIQFLQCPNKINLMGPSHFYMEISGLNNIDETSPYNLSPFTRQTNITNGRVNIAFAKVGVTGLPLSMFYDVNSEQNYKLYDPPADRIRRLQIQIRYHNGLLVDFETFNYTFCLEFTLMDPRISTKYKMRGGGV
jgi:hypothetical protein